MTTGVIDKNGIEISVGDIVHYRGKGLCAHGIVIQDDYYGFAILDDRPKTKGRKYSLAYHDRSIVQMVYRDIYGELHRNFDCRSYKEIARKNIDKAVDVIERYTLPMFLVEKVDKANAMI